MLLKRLPLELRGKHIERIAHLEDEEAAGYLYALHERRDAALRESVVSDSVMAPFFAEHQEEIWHALETHVFTDTENYLGNGQTAQVKRFDLNQIDEEHGTEQQSVAVKYLVTPDEYTLSVSGEHDLILEVEQIVKIEQAELQSLGSEARIRVPHPYFYYKNRKIQCYAMQLIDGVNLEVGTSGDYDPELKADFQKALKEVNEENLLKEIDSFFDTMHTICEHGDIKKANIMVSRDGHFYVIDFGRSRLKTSMDERAQATSEEWKEGEKKRAKQVISDFLRALNAEETPTA